jgi:hypothetical protein
VSGARSAGISVTLQECCLAELALLHQFTERRPQSLMAGRWELLEMADQIIFCAAHWALW